MDPKLSSSSQTAPRHDSASGRFHPSASEGQNRTKTQHDKLDSVGSRSSKETQRHTHQIKDPTLHLKSENHKGSVESIHTDRDRKRKRREESPKITQHHQAPSFKKGKYESGTDKYTELEQPREKNLDSPDLSKRDRPSIQSSTRKRKHLDKPPQPTIESKRSRPDRKQQGYLASNTQDSSAPGKVQSARDYPSTRHPSTSRDSFSRARRRHTRIHSRSRSPISKQGHERLYRERSYGRLNPYNEHKHQKSLNPCSKDDLKRYGSVYELEQWVKTHSDSLGLLHNLTYSIQNCISPRLN